MSRIETIDAIRRELMKQRAEGRLRVAVREVPDTFFVNGILDVDRLAKAIRDEP